MVACAASEFPRGLSLSQRIDHPRHRRCCSAAILIVTPLSKGPKSRPFDCYDFKRTGNLGSGKVPRLRPDGGLMISSVSSSSHALSIGL